MKNVNKILVIFSLLVILSGSAFAISFPPVGATNWATDSNYGIQNWLLVSHTENGTLRNDLNSTFNSLNISKDLIVVGNIFGEFPDSFKNSNFTNLYDLRTDRFNNENFSVKYDARGDRFNNANFSLNYDGKLDRYLFSNFTSNYDSRVDRFTIENGTKLPFSNFNIGNYSILEAAAFRNENFTTLYNNNQPRWELSNDTSNWNSLYNAKTDRFNNENFSINFNSFIIPYQFESSTFKNTNFSTLALGLPFSNWQISNQTARETAYFKIENGTSLPFSNFQKANLTNVLFTNNASFVIANEQNPTNATIVIPSTQVTGLGDFAVLNDLPNNNVSTSKILNNAVTTGKLANGIPLSTFTNDVNYFLTSAFAEAFDTNFSSKITANVSVNTNHLICWKTSTTLGYCSDDPTNTDGTCTCN